MPAYAKTSSSAASRGVNRAILDPHEGPGAYVKAQLHVHTERSRGGEWGLAEAVEHYRQLGYSFLCITDHGRVAVPSCTDMGGILVVPGEENTVPDPFWPLGRHMLRLFVSSPATSGRAQERINPALQGGVVALAHLLARYHRAGHRCIYLRYLGQANEVRNLHSDRPDVDLHSVLTQRMPNRGLGRRGRRCGCVRMRPGMGIETGPEITGEAFERPSSREDSATTVPCAFWVRGSAICARTARPSVIRFINREGIVVQTTSDATEAEYVPAISDGFVLVEVVDPDGKRGWSQPFTIAPLPIRVET